MLVSKRGLTQANAILLSILIVVAIVSIAYIIKENIFYGPNVPIDLPPANIFDDPYNPGDPNGGPGGNDNLAWVAYMYEEYDGSDVIRHYGFLPKNGKAPREHASPEDIVNKFSAWTFLVSLRYGYAEESDLDSEDALANFVNEKYDEALEDLNRIEHDPNAEIGYEEDASDGEYELLQSPPGDDGCGPGCEPSCPRCVWECCPAECGGGAGGGTPQPDGKVTKEDYDVLTHLLFFTPIGYGSAPIPGAGVTGRGITGFQVYPNDLPPVVDVPGENLEEMAMWHTAVSDDKVCSNDPEQSCNVDSDCENPDNGYDVPEGVCIEGVGEKIAFFPWAFVIAIDTPIPGGVADAGILTIWLSGVLIAIVVGVGLTFTLTPSKNLATSAGEAVWELLEGSYDRICEIVGSWFAAMVAEAGWEQHKKFLEEILGQAIKATKACISLVSSCWSICFDVCSALHGLDGFEYSDCFINCVKGDSAIVLQDGSDFISETCEELRNTCLLGSFDNPPAN